jgi:RHS repeat-associated protein
MSPGIVAESDLNGTLKSEYVFFNGERVARKDFPGNAVAFYFSDHLKTASVITDAAGTIRSESDFYPWGGELQFLANDSNHYKFTGKERDTESGFDYFGARYYLSPLGRWVSADWSATPEPVPYADFGDPQSLHQYTYVRNIPTARFDADGHDGGAATAVWEFVSGGTEVSAGMWTIGSVALPGMIGGGLVYKGINSIANDNDTVANAEMQYQVVLNNVAVRINEMVRAGKSTEQLRKEWEKLTGQKWPKDTNTGANQDAHHKDAKADGGADTAENIEPKPHVDHVDHHKKMVISEDGESVHIKSPLIPNPNHPNLSHRSRSHHQNRSKNRNRVNANDK